MDTKEKTVLIAGTTVVVVTAIAGISFVCGKVVTVLSKQN